MSEETTQSFPPNAFQMSLASLDKIDARLDNMESRLEQLEARAYDPKPVWENALKEIVELNGKFVELNGKVDNLRGDLDSGFRHVERKIDILNQNILEVCGDSREWQESLEKLEVRPSN